MPGILDRLKEGKDRAAFEADRLRRQTQAQSALRNMQRQLEAQTAALGTMVLGLHDAGTLAQPELVAACQPIDALRKSITAQEAEVERIRQERPPAAPVPGLYGHICPRCQILLGPEATFCPRCGGPAADVAPPPPPAPAGPPCARCGAPLALSAAFCGQCGAPVRAAAPPPPPPPPARCTSCGASVAAEALFCPVCGTALGAAPAAPAPIEDWLAREAPRAPEQPAPWLPEPAAAQVPPPPEQVLEAGVECPFCLTEVPSEATFCPECGATLRAVPAPMPVVEAAPPPPPPPPTPAAEPEAAPPPPPPTPAAEVTETWEKPAIEARAALRRELEEVAGELAKEGQPAPAPAPAAAHTAVCSVCGTQIPADATFCPECGSRVSR